LNGGGTQKLYTVISNYRKSDTYMHFQNYTREQMQPIKNKITGFLLCNL